MNCKYIQCIEIIPITEGSVAFYFMVNRTIRSFLLNSRFS